MKSLFTGIATGILTFGVTYTGKAGLACGGEYLGSELVS